MKCAVGLVLLGALAIMTSCREQSGKSDSGSLSEETKMNTTEAHHQDKAEFLKSLSDAKKAAKIDEPDSMKKVAVLFIHGLEQGYVTDHDVLDWGDQVSADGYGAEGVLGAIYLYGSDGVTRNTKQALYWLNKAIERKGSQAGNAEYLLGMMYMAGDGVPKDINRAVGCFLKASDEGVPAAMSLLGRAHLQGQLGFEKDTAQGLALLQKAANKGDANASMFLGHLYAKGADVAQSLPKAMEWYQQAATAGNAHAQYIIGLAYLDGTQGLPENYESAVKWLKLAAGQDHVDAMLMLSACYSTGKGTPVNDELARVWKQRALELNNQRQNNQHETK